MDTFETIIIINGISYPGYVWFDTFRIVFDIAEIRYEIPFDWTSVQYTFAWEADESLYYRTVYRLYDNNGNSFDFADYVNNYEQSTSIYGDLFDIKKKEAARALRKQNIDAYRRKSRRINKSSELERKIRQIEEVVYSQDHGAGIQRDVPCDAEENLLETEKPKACAEEPPVVIISPKSEPMVAANIPDCIYLKGRKCNYLNDTCRPNSFRCRKKYPIIPTVTPTTYDSSSYSSGKGVDVIPSHRGDFSGERYGTNAERVNLGDMKSSIPQIFLFRGGLKIPKDEIIDALITVADFHGFSKTLFVAYNLKNQRIYLSYDQLDYYIRKKIHLKVKIIKSNKGTKSLKAFSTFSEFHILALYGYKTGKSGLNTPEREEILKFIFDNEILKGIEIVEHLRECIRLRENRTDKDFSKAIEHWKHDIDYVRKIAMESGKPIHLGTLYLS